MVNLYRLPSGPSFPLKSEGDQSACMYCTVLYCTVYQQDAQTFPLVVGWVCTDNTEYTIRYLSILHPPLYSPPFFPTSKRARELIKERKKKKEKEGKKRGQHLACEHGHRLRGLAAGGSQPSNHGSAPDENLRTGWCAPVVACRAGLGYDDVN